MDEISDSTVVVVLEELLKSNEVSAHCIGCCWKIINELTEI
jgi:hypothetical protein